MPQEAERRWSLYFDEVIDQHRSHIAFKESVVEYSRFFLIVSLKR